MKKILSILSVSLFALALVVLAGYGFWQYRNGKVKKIVVHIQRQGAQGFLSEKKIKSLINAQDKVVGYPVKTVNSAQIEKVISKNPYVKNVDVYLSILGNIMVNVTERIPLLRIYNLKNRSRYVDMKGNIFPLSSYFVPRVLPVNGYVKARLITGKNIHDSLYRHTLLPGLYSLAKKIRANPFLEADISQLFVNSKGEIDMVPELGRHIIHFGDSNQMDVKLENLEAFYKQVFVREGWSKYRSINLEFTNQIVCTKKQSYGK
ncbi:MAG: cell division protein FtsQ [bacterium]|nr:MAG: cell division protein FtsQ [bacterium]